MEPRSILRIEGLIIASSALIGYFSLGGPLWMLVVVGLAPDLSMLGYLKDTEVGSVSYNLVHTYSIPLVVGTSGVWFGRRTLMLLALIWVAHIGIDRLFGYGLKYRTGFRDTHLSGHLVPVQNAIQGENG